MESTHLDHASDAAMGGRSRATRPGHAPATQRRAHCAAAGMGKCVRRSTLQRLLLINSTLLQSQCLLRVPSEHRREWLGMRMTPGNAYAFVRLLTMDAGDRLVAFARKASDNSIRILFLTEVLVADPALPIDDISLPRVIHTEIERTVQYREEENKKARKRRRLTSGQDQMSTTSDDQTSTTSDEESA